MKKRSFLAVTLLCLAVSSAYPQAASAPPSGLTPLVDYLKPPLFASPTISPSGRYLAVSTPINGRRNLAVVDMDTRKGTSLTNFRDFDVIDVRWVGNDRIVFSLGQANSPTGPGQFDGGGFFVISRDGGESRKLAPTIRELRASRNFVLRSMELIHRIPGSTDEVLVAANLRSEDAEDVYRLNLVTGRTTVVSSDRPSRTSDWVLDNNLVPRVVTSWIKDTLIYVTYYRSAADAPWREIARTDRSTGRRFDVDSFLSDNKTLLVSSNEGRDTAAIFKFDPETKQYGELLAQHPRYDMDGVITEPDTDRLIGYFVNAEKPQTVWVDEKEAKTQATVDGALKGTRNVFRRFPNSTRLLVTAYSDVEPARYYLLDEEKRTLEELFASRPWLGKAQLVEMRPFTLKTRDGLEIPSYYFLPKNYKPGDKLPTVVHIHGGPHARADSWASGFGYSEAQILASRGYAVVLPNFRITPGFGAKIFRAGFGTVGRQMSEDHEDAVKWAIDQGFADPKRICISGASYGGYAVLRALAKTPELFKCGIAGLPISDFELWLSSPAGDVSYNAAGLEFWNQLLGNSQDKNAGRDNSPVHMAARIKAPVLMYEGSDDIRTPVEQT
ncbi:MAG: alpha/beta fold hydrolase, partial [Caldimonas sp.]